MEGNFRLLRLSFLRPQQSRVSIDLLCDTKLKDFKINSNILLILNFFLLSTLILHIYTLTIYQQII